MMKPAKFISVALMLMLIVGNLQMSTANPPSELNSLEQLQWEHRVIIINTNTHDSKSIEETIRTQKPEIDDRHIVWFIVSRQAETIDITSNYLGTLSRSFHKEVVSFVNEDHKRVTLIGKDGGIKAQSSSLNLNDIFALIDTMPMRISEMK